MRIIHTADWQIGKPFRQFGDDESVLRQARLTAIENIGHLAKRENVRHVLVAGDVYDSDTPAQRTLLEPLERMRQFPLVQWHLMPGNHDPHRPKGIWDRVLEIGAPPNVHLCLTPEPVALDECAVLLPAPLSRKSENGDLTEWMDRAETAPGTIRIGIAHGSVVGFGSSGEATNPIDPGRTGRADLDYLALGDWHGTKEISAAVWYSGTPEPDRAGGQETGQALVVEIAGHGAPVSVTRQVVGTYRWLTRDERVDDTTDLADFERRIRALSDLSRLVLRLTISGTLPLAGRSEFDKRIHALQAAMFRCDVDDLKLVIRPDLSDLETIDFGGVLRQAAERLAAMAQDEAGTAQDRRRAESALVQLYAMTDAGVGT